MNLELKDIKGKLSTLPTDQQKELLKLLESYEEAKNKEDSKTDFLTFVKMMWSSFIGGPHHQVALAT